MAIILVFICNNNSSVSAQDYGNPTKSQLDLKNDINVMLNSFSNYTSVGKTSSLSNVGVYRSGILEFFNYYSSGYPIIAANVKVISRTPFINYESYSRAKAEGLFNDILNDAVIPSWYDGDQLFIFVRSQLSNKSSEHMKKLFQNSDISDEYLSKISSAAQKANSTFSLIIAFEKIDKTKEYYPSVVVAAQMELDKNDEVYYFEPKGEKQDVITVNVNGNKLDFDVPPQIINDRTMVPLRKIFEALGAEVTWDDKTNTSTGKKGTTTVILTVDSTSATVNGELKTLDVPATLVDGRTLVPARFISESLGCQVDWDAESRTVVITSK